MTEYKNPADLLSYILNKENLHVNTEFKNDDDDKSNASTPSFCRSVKSLSPKSLSPKFKRSALSPLSISPCTKYGSKYGHLFGYNINESPVIEEEPKESPFCLWPMEINAAAAAPPTIEVNTIATSPFNIIEVTTVAKNIADENDSISKEISSNLPIASPIMKVVKRNISSKKEKAKKASLIAPFEKLTTKKRSNNKVALFISYVFLWSIVLFFSTIRYSEFWKTFDPLLKTVILKRFNETYSKLTEIHEVKFNINDEINNLSENFVHFTIDIIANQLVTDEGLNSQPQQNLKQNAFKPINTINPDWKDSSFESIFINFN